MNGAEDNKTCKPWCKPRLIFAPAILPSFLKSLMADAVERNRSPKQEQGIFSKISGKNRLAERLLAVSIRNSPVIQISYTIVQTPSGAWLNIPERY